MDKKPKLTVSGYRGIWDKDLSEVVAYEYARSFARLVTEKGGKNILVGRDARKTGPQIEKAIKEASEKEGVAADFAGILPTPSVLLLTRKLGYGGGIIITASHNPPEYNGLKFVGSDGFFISQKDIDRLGEIKKDIPADYEGISTTSPADSDGFMDIHIGEITKNVDMKTIKSKRFKVALDPINSAGSVITEKLLNALGCEPHIINKEQTGDFTHEPEPLVKNLGEISRETIRVGADIGFAQDPDADRLVVVNEKGEILSEEYTLALAAKNVLAKGPGEMAINMSTSRMCEDLGVKVWRTKIGELNVVEKMKEIGAVIGGEGNGGVIYPKMNFCRDSLAGIALILELMAKDGRRISEIASKIPKYHMRKEKVDFSGNLEELYARLQKKWPEAKVNTLDGIRLDWEDRSWLHVRPSNTEPVVRIIGEAPSEERLNFLFEQYRTL